MQESDSPNISLRGACPQGVALETVLSQELDSTIQSYLCTLSNEVPDSTYLSHKTTLQTFCEWCITNSVRFDGPIEEDVCQFIQHLLWDSDLAIATVRSHICSLGNYLAYAFQQNPELVMHHLASPLVGASNPDLETLGKQIIGNRVSETSSVTSSDVIESLISDLRQRQFGTRTHAYLELLLDTKSRPEQIRQLNLKDLALKRGQVRVGIPDTHVVNTVGLVTERSVALTKKTVDAVETYVEYERDDVIKTEAEPLFTTLNGRASRSTLRRSIKRASQEAVSNSSLTQQPSGASLTEHDVSEIQPQPITPNDVWQYATSKILEVDNK
ncbi:Site-specific recombinase XerD [Natronorubrum thiooxidans]|uniref:Site-specific recombinase XerD n=2 Tax=Natronorubrum thiooxidans TaxID=308853 RepID=A0A1N7HBE9_9EURY|nr:Site-specific recombinase XerD [Natronorubrum thiooxidans]